MGFTFSFPVSREPLDECSIGVDKCQLALWLWPILSACLWLLIYLPIILYHSRQYYLRSHHIIYRNRYSGIVILQIKTFLIQLIFALNNIFAVWYVDQVQPLYCIYLSIETSVSIYLYYLFVWRFYLIYFDINFIIESKNNQWIAVINPLLFKPKSADKDINFLYFLLNRNSLGNKTFLYKNIILPCVVISALLFTFTELVVSFAFQTQGQFGDDSAFATGYSVVITLKVIPFIILAVIYHKMPSFEDEFYVTLELQRLFLCFLMCIICIYSATLMQIWTQENLLWNAIIGPCVTYNTIIFWHTVTTYVCTGWVNKKVETILTADKYVVRNVQLPMNSQTTPYEVEYVQYNSTRSRGLKGRLRDDSVRAQIKANLFNINISSPEIFSKSGSMSLQIVDQDRSAGSSSKREEIKLTDIIAHEKAFTSFMSHLAGEFSMEILLSVYEFVQYKELIQQYMDLHQISRKNTEENANVETIAGLIRHNCNTADMFAGVKLPETYPQSFIVYGEETEVLQLPLDEFITHCKDVVSKLYIKYVSVGSSWEINLSYYVRRKVKKIVNSEQFLQNETIGLDQLFVIYDECIRCMFSVMRDSYDRFKRTHQYRKLKNLMLL